MSRSLFALLLVCVVASAARADGVYYSESVGDSKIGDQLAAYLPSATRVRVAIGLRRGAWAIEGYFSADISNNEIDPSNPPSLTALGLDVKYLHPITRHLELYLRGGPSEGYASGPLDGYSGRGLGFGAGIQLKGKVPALGFLFFPFFFTNLGPKVTASLYVDDGYDFYRLFRDGSPSIDAQITHITGGFAVGTDF